MRTLGTAIIIAIAVALCLLVLTSFVSAGLLADQVTLESLTVGRFIDLYRLGLVYATVAGLAGTIGWLVYGSKTARAMALPRAGTVWRAIWFVELLAGAAGVVLLLLIFYGESFSPGNLAFFFAAMSLHTWIFYWACSLCLSHRTVRYLPWLSR